jgi:hypothetical protein
MKPAARQIWKEDERRYERYVLVTHVWTDLAVIITCDAEGMPRPGSKHTNAKLSRFNKAGGYKYVRDVGEVIEKPRAKAAAIRLDDCVHMAPGSYIRDDGAVMVETERHCHINQDIALQQGLIARRKG